MKCRCAFLFKVSGWAHRWSMVPSKHPWLWQMQPWALETWLKQRQPKWHHFCWEGDLLFGGQNGKRVTCCRNLGKIGKEVCTVAHGVCSIVADCSLGNLYVSKTLNTKYTSRAEYTWILSQMFFPIRHHQKTVAGSKAAMQLGFNCHTSFCIWELTGQEICREASVKMHVCVCVCTLYVHYTEYATTGVFVDVDVKTRSIHIDISIYEGIVW